MNGLDSSTSPHTASSTCAVLILVPTLESLAGLRTKISSSRSRFIHDLNQSRGWTGRRWATADQSNGRVPSTTLERNGAIYLEANNRVQGKRQMSSSRTSSPDDLKRSTPLSLNTRDYFRARLRNRLYNYIVQLYLEREKDGTLNQRALAARIRRRPEVVNRLLMAPGNWTLDTVSDLLLGIGPAELDMSSSSVVDRAPRNDTADDHLLRDEDKMTGKPASGGFDPAKGVGISYA